MDRFDEILKKAREACKDNPDSVAGYLASLVQSLEWKLKVANEKLDDVREGAIR